MGLILIPIIAFASYKLALEKGQNNIIWPLISAFFIPGLAVQYLISIYKQNNKTSL